ncbi:M23 family metallopeptidase [bacterium]|nr:M23 family metallopeptidase [bacterium]MBU1637473.1 M23 family metallopeptidase [bacterium]
MAKNGHRGWTLLVLGESDSNHRQFRVSKGFVYTLISFVCIVLVVAIGETFAIWHLKSKASQVAPLTQRIEELEATEQKVAELGKEITDLQSFEKQLRLALSAEGSDSLADVPWTRSGVDGEDDTLMYLKAEEAIPKRNAFILPSMTSLESSDIPTYLPVRGYITRKYTTLGPYKYASHHGLDIAAREGIPILAAADGTVLFAGWTYPYGQLIIISHPSGFSTFYGHNQAMLVTAGENVIQGQPIGLLGNSGRSTAPHLHFEIWEGDHPIDPLTMLQPED